MATAARPLAVLLQYLPAQDQLPASAGRLRRVDGVQMVEHVVEFYSKLLSPQDAKRSQPVLECLAVLAAVTHFQTLHLGLPCYGQHGCTSNSVAHNSGT